MTDSAPAVSVPDEIQIIVDALDDKRAKDITVLDLTGVSDALDWFVIATGDSQLQLQALEGRSSIDSRPRAAARAGWRGRRSAGC
jgi:ribosomal silencing factor RsfS